MGPIHHIKQYIKNDKRRFWIISNKLWWIPYQQYEYTRLKDIRGLMNKHMSYKKESIIGD